ncbi:hypothetical protein B0H13DRAFT_1918696 [Mycena leptocephala]|nr:hypothetical protein B0H13DRAFT_1918696 [Mycena leptocephala]
MAKLKFTRRRHGARPREDVIAGFNGKLAAKIAAFKANNTGTWVWDANAAFTTTLNESTQFGFVDATSYGNTGDFWAAAHQIFAKLISALLGQGEVAIYGSILMVVDRY